MAIFLTGEQLANKITDIIFEAERKLIILSPFIKLDDYFKKLFSNHIKNHNVELIIVFGKNQDDKGKSLSKDDFDFFKQFPYVSILYSKNLHAKYYANEKAGIITSINLYDYSFKNNIEFGIYQESGIFNITSGRNLDKAAWDKACEIAQEAHVVFIKRPVLQKRIFFGDNYISSETCFDNTKFFLKNSIEQDYAKERYSHFPDFIEYGKPQFSEKPARSEDAPYVSLYSAPRKSNSPYYNHTATDYKYKGFCIRTGQEMKYNLTKPFKPEAFRSWSAWGNQDYQEKFCHACGKPATTSMRNPLCKECL